ncbi:MAG: iron ABC transporter permease [Candidatus Methanomethylophilaceae archaeon]|nr:iron ABC transporter permease [Candidatus Methanomethylophilaceae archaeon]MBR7006809.1 iron ABC transporter permease [Candidatus Methanomethylophilaceae archaeon]
MEDYEADPRISRIVSHKVTRWLSEDADLEQQEESFLDYKRYVARKWVFMAICVVVIVMVMGFAVTYGTYDIGFLESYQIIWDHLTDNITNTTKDHIIVNLRMPRVVVGIVAGAGLSVAGAVMQSTLMNPLADSYTTGVSSGASFGATLAMTLGMTAAAGSQAIVINAFLFALIPTAMIISVSKMKNASPTTMIMAGIAIMYIFNAFTTVMMLWADESTLAEVYQWQVGTLAGTTWNEVPVMIVAVLAGIIAVQLLSRKLNVLATGDETARALGVDASKMRIILLVIVALMSAAVVSFTGLIGFVGLVTPHIVRIFIGADNRYLIPASAIAGSALLVTADLLGRAILSPVVLQVGVVMAFIGGPMFLWLLMRKNSRVWG